MPEFNYLKIADQVLKGDTAAASKLIRMAEEEDPLVYRAYRY